MTGRSKFIFTLVCVFLGFILIQVVLYLTHKTVTRTPASLMQQYYRLQETDPPAAKRTLEMLIKQDPHYQKALRELAFWYLNQGDVRNSVIRFEIAYQNDNHDIKSALELSKLYIALHQTDKAYAILTKISNLNDPLSAQAKALLNEIPAPKELPPVNLSPELSPESEQLVAMMPTLQLPINVTKQSVEQRLASILQHQHVLTAESASHLVNEKSGVQAIAAVSTVSDRDKMMNEFYDLKRNNSPKAWEKINEVIAKYPNDVQALKEAGYYALMTLKSDKIAETYFLRVYELTQDPKIALQLGYIYDKLRQKRIAYHYFDLATHTSDLKDRMTAEIAKTNLRGVQTLFLPYPYYAQLDFSPLYMSRFKLLIYPVIFRLGVLLNETYNWRIYLSYRRTSDDKSNTTNQISSIFEDNAAVTAIGSVISPLYFAPQLIAFAELGKSVDIVYRNRSRFRSDFRGGIAYYNEWGKYAIYTLKPTLMAKPYVDIYADAIYYNRYHDGIASLRIRPGYKVFQYGSTSLEIYYRFFVIQDQARQFYNNIMEVGPGFAFRFSDRYNIVLRYEQVHGRYLPANSPSFNPYSTNYHNTITSLNTYFEF